MDDLSSEVTTVEIQSTCSAQKKYFTDKNSQAENIHPANPQTYFTF